MLFLGDVIKAPISWKLESFNACQHLHVPQQVVKFWVCSVRYDTMTIFSLYDGRTIKHYNNIIRLGLYFNSIIVFSALSKREIIATVEHVTSTRPCCIFSCAWVMWRGDLSCQYIDHGNISPITYLLCRQLGVWACRTIRLGKPSEVPHCFNADDIAWLIMLTNVVSLSTVRPASQHFKF